MRKKSFGKNDKYVIKKLFVNEVDDQKTKGF